MIHQRTLNALEFDKIVHYVADLCVTPPGRTMAQALQPLPDQPACDKEFILFGEYQLWRSNESSDDKSFSITSFPDVSPVINSALGYPRGDIINRGYDLDTFWAVREMLRPGKQAVDSMQSPRAQELCPLLGAMAKAEPFPDSLLAALNRCISDDGLLKDESSPELWRIRNELRGLHQQCLRKVKDYAKQYNMSNFLQDDFMTLSSDRYVVPLKANFKGRMQGIIHDWSQTGETCYFEPIFLVEINNRLAGLKREEHEEERKILDYLAGLLVESAHGCQRVYEFLGKLDFLNAKMLLAGYLDCHCPAFSPAKDGIELIKARHPLLALNRQADQLRQGDAAVSPVRPIDIILRPEQRVLVITGGNAGGKTVCLKTMGMIVAMAMSGLPVPCGKGSHLPWFSRMDAFIGDEQSLENNVSTFTAQIEHLAKAWKHLNSSGLVLLDEFGAGTDPAEGSALAQAVLDGLLEKECAVLCATHFPSLKSYALANESVAAASMLFDPATNRPLFKLAYGQVGASHALIVAKEYGLPESIIQRANHYLLRDGHDQDAILSRLNALAAEREKEIESLRREKQKTTNELEEKSRKLVAERQRLQTEIKGRISELLSAWKSGKSTARQTMKALSRERASLLPREEEKSLLQAEETPAVGKTVFHAGINKSGRIMEIDERRKRARLDMDGVTLWADFSLLKQKTGNKPEPSGRSMGAPAPANIGMSLDVRGLRGEEAIAETARFIDRAILGGFSEVEIIHGRGTGALRRQIHEFLQSSRGVAQVDLAPEDRGGDGMTIVTLK